MSEQGGPEDDQLWLRLREAVAEQDELPAAVRAAAEASFTWRTVDDELAEILHDSALATSGTRASATATRTLSLGREGGPGIELEIGPDGVLGQLVPVADGVELSLQQPGRSDVAIPVDDLGTFAITPTPTAPFRLRLQGGVRLTTAWISADLPS